MSFLGTDLATEETMSEFEVDFVLYGYPSNDNKGSSLVSPLVRDSPTS